MGDLVRVLHGGVPGPWMLGVEEAGAGAAAQNPEETSRNSHVLRVRDLRFRGMLLLLVPNVLLLRKHETGEPGTHLSQE